MNHKRTIDFWKGATLKDHKRGLICYSLWSQCVVNVWYICLMTHRFIPPPQCVESGLICSVWPWVWPLYWKKKNSQWKLLHSPSKKGHLKTMTCKINFLIFSPEEWSYPGLISILSIKIHIAVSKNTPFNCIRWMLLNISLSPNTKPLMSLFSKRKF